MAQFPAEVQARLNELRQTIAELVPEATETMTEFAEELAEYKSGKGTARFPLDESLPLDLTRASGLARAVRRRAAGVALRYNRVR